MDFFNLVPAISSNQAIIDIDILEAKLEHLLNNAPLAKQLQQVAKGPQYYWHVLHYIAHMEQSLKSPYLKLDNKWRGKVIQYIAEDPLVNQ